MFSILYPNEPALLSEKTPDCFADINLDQVFYSILKEKQDFNLDPFFYSPLPDVKSVIYRQEVLRELEDEFLRSAFNEVFLTIGGIGKISEAIHSQLGAGFADKWRDNYLVRGQLINCVDAYCGAVSALSAKISGLDLKSQGLKSFAHYLAGYCASSGFINMHSSIIALREKLSKVRYNMLIKGSSVKVRRYEGEEAFSGALLSLLEKFKQGDSIVYVRPMPEMPVSEKVEAAVLKIAAKEFKDVFGEIDTFCDKYYNFIDETLLRFSREIQFYLGWLDFIAPLRNAGLNFCYPRFAERRGDFYARETFDIALAHWSHGEGIVTNDFDFHVPEHIAVITGPNQGGKTTFARSFAQAHFLASLGLCVPGSSACLRLCDKVLTHFGKQEDLSLLSGQLQDDLVRLRAVFDNATENSVLIINEIFASTTLQDALELGKRMIEKLVLLGAPALVITFLDELARHGRETISMVSDVREDDPSKRTYKIVRKEPDGLAFAIHIAGKYGVTYDKLKERLGRIDED